MPWGPTARVGLSLISLAVLATVFGAGSEVLARRRAPRSSLRPKDIMPAEARIPRRDPGLLERRLRAGFGPGPLQAQA